MKSGHKYTAKIWWKVFWNNSFFFWKTIDNNGALWYNENAVITRRANLIFNVGTTKWNHKQYACVI